MSLPPFRLVVCFTLFAARTTTFSIVVPFIVAVPFTITLLVSLVVTAARPWLKVLLPARLVAPVIAVIVLPALIAITPLLCAAALFLFATTLSIFTTSPLPTMSRWLFLARRRFNLLPDRTFELCGVVRFLQRLSQIGV